MAAADVSGLLDLASAPSPTPVPTPEPVEEVVDNALEPTDTPEAPPEGDDSPEAPPEGVEKPVDGRTNPAAIRSALKAFRDLDPKNGPIARELNDAYGRYSAYKSVFPKVADAQNAKAVLDAVGGHDGITSLQETLKSVSETDSLLYSGDPRVLDSIIEDMKAENKLDAFTKLASPFLDKLAKIDEEGYQSTIRPHLLNALELSRFPNAVQGILKALTDPAKPDVASIKAIAESMSQWYDEQKKQVGERKTNQPDPEREAFERERTQFQSDKQKAFTSEVIAEVNRENNRILGTALKPFLQLPMAKNWTPATKQSLAREIVLTLNEELAADKTYQSQMGALWNAKSPDKGKITNFHRSKVETIGGRIVKQVLENRYPGFTKSGGRTVAKPVAKPGQAATQPGVTPKPLYQTTKPDGANVDWERDPDRLLWITGRYYDKKGAFRTWNPKYR